MSIKNYKGVLYKARKGLSSVTNIPGIVFFSSMLPIVYGFHSNSSFPDLKMPAPNPTFIFTPDQNENKEGRREWQHLDLKSKIYIKFR